MSKKADKLGKTLETGISEYLGKPFSLDDYTAGDKEGNTYKVIGTIKRYATRVKIEVEVDKATLEPRYWSITNKRIKMPVERVGSIELGDKACVTDPCYDRDVWCMTTLQNIKPGKWEVFVSIDEIDAWGKRLYILELCHSSLSDEQKAKLKWRYKDDLGVDSGQMSVFDDAFYRRKDGSEEAFKEDSAMADDFYDRCCKLTREYFGIYYSDGKPVGVVCSSGCGDGSYPLKVSEVDNEIVAMTINFM